MFKIFSKSFPPEIQVQWFLHITMLSKEQKTQHKLQQTQEKLVQGQWPRVRLKCISFKRPQQTAPECPWQGLLWRVGDLTRGKRAEIHIMCDPPHPKHWPSALISLPHCRFTQKAAISQHGVLNQQLPRGSLLPLLSGLSLSA